MNTLHVKTGDTVVVLSGKDKGKEVQEPEHVQHSEEEISEDEVDHTDPTVPQASTPSTSSRTSLAATRGRAWTSAGRRRSTRSCGGSTCRACALRAVARCWC